MLRFLCNIPNNSFVACSGGVDSMVVCDFLLKSKKKFSIVHVHHGTEHADDAYKFVKEYASSNKIPLITTFIKPYSQTAKKASCEEYWRNERYKIFNALGKNVITAHHLDDAVEWWVFSSMHGNGKLIPVQNKNVIRPLLITEKKKILDWADRKKLNYVKDPSNNSVKYKRNLIRHNIMPQILELNPGIRKVIKKKYLESKFYE